MCRLNIRQFIISVPSVLAIQFSLKAWVLQSSVQKRELLETCITGSKWMGVCPDNANQQNEMAWLLKLFSHLMTLVWVFFQAKSKALSAWGFLVALRVLILGDASLSGACVMCAQPPRLPSLAMASRTPSPWLPLAQSGDRTSSEADSLPNDWWTWLYLCREIA